MTMLAFFDEVVGADERSRVSKISMLDTLDIDGNTFTANPGTHWEEEMGQGHPPGGVVDPVTQKVWVMVPDGF